MANTQDRRTVPHPELREEEIVPGDTGDRDSNQGTAGITHRSEPAPGLPLVLTVNRTGGGRYQAIIAGHGGGPVEGETVDELLDNLKPAVGRCLEDAEDLQAARDGLRDAEVHGTVPFDQVRAELRI